MPPVHPAAAEALAAMRRTQAHVAAAAECPPARHLAFAAILAALTVCPAAPPVGMIVIELAVIAAVLGVIAWDRRRTGMFINGYRAGATRPVVFSLLAVQTALFVLSYWLTRDRGVTWAPYPLALASLALGWFGSRLWMRVWRRELSLPA